VLAAALLTQGAYWFRDAAGVYPSWLAGGLGVTTGTLLLIGFLTPAAAAGAIGLWLFPGRTSNLFAGGFSEAFALAILLSLIMLGPGAFSIDARLFGRREIIIPRIAPRPECRND